MFVSRSRKASFAGGFVRAFAGVVFGAALAAAGTSSAVAADPVRARDLGVEFQGEPGKLNAITDVKGVEVGHFTKIDPPGAGGARTGVTAIFPLGKDAPREGVFASQFALNGVGELTGSHLINGTGLLFGPIALTGTTSLGTVYASTVEWLRRRHRDDVDAFLDQVLLTVGETYDRLNDPSKEQLLAEDVFAALEGAKTGPVTEGNVGGGTPMKCFDFKCGAGTASRVVEIDGKRYTVGVFVQSNFGRREQLMVSGVSVGRELTDRMPTVVSSLPAQIDRTNVREGSIIVIIATDAPLLPKQLNEMAKRASVGVARTGGTGDTGSGDIFLAFSTAHRHPSPAKGELKVKMLGPYLITDLYRAVAYATEEAIINSLVAGETMASAQGYTVYGIPHDRLQAIMADVP
ncbi:MAG: P1 family peptidase [Pseudomonadota bacterium]